MYFCFQTDIPSVYNTIPNHKMKGAAKGEEVTLYVEVIANPKLNPQDFTWWRGTDGSADEEVSGDEFEVMNTDTRSTLTILNITEGHFGNYKVTASNKHGALSDDGSNGVTFEVTPHSKYNL